MKKNPDSIERRLYGILSKQNIRAMKMTIVLMMLTVCQIWAVESYAQSAKISLKLEDTKISEALKAIEEQTEFYFLYSPKLIDVEREVDIEVENVTVDKVLAQIFGNAISKVIYDRQIVLSPRGIPNVVSNNQQKTISGIVFDDKGDPLPGVTVVIKGTKSGTFTDSEGRFSLNADSTDDILVFSFVGYVTQEIAVGLQTSINVTLQESLTRLDEIVVTGYQTQRKIDIIGAVSVTNEEDIKDIPDNNPLKALQGRISGVYVETDGSPYSGVRKFMIRGLNTLGNNNPLVIIDNMPSSTSALQTLNSNDIESIQVLKDASAASIYGARASNGVLIITTKTGGGKFNVEFNSKTTIQDYNKSFLIDVLDTYQYGRVLWRASVNDGVDPSLQPHYNYVWHIDGNGNPVLDNLTANEWLDEASGTKTANTDWYDEICRNGIATSNNIIISSGTDKSNMFVSFNYYTNDGVVKATDYDQFAARINTSTSFFNGKIKIGENLQLSKSKETPQPFGIIGHPLSNAAVLPSIIPVYTVNGDFAGPAGGGFSPTDNPVNLIEINKWDKNSAIKTLGDLNLTVEPIENLVFRSTFGIDYANYYSKDIKRKYQTGIVGSPENSLSNNVSYDINWVWSNTLNYQLELSKQRISFLIGTEAIKNEYQYNNVTRKDYHIEEEEYFYIDAGAGEITASGSATGYQLLSYFGKVNYSLLNKYLAAITLRYDGSSRFGINNRFGFFPALNLGWILSNEKFISENLDFISLLKLRYGMGKVGNQEIGNEARFGLYVIGYGSYDWMRLFGTAYDIVGNNSGLLPSGYMSTQTANPDLKWESTNEINVGIDVDFLDHKITSSFDYFIRQTEDILLRPPYAAVIGEGGSMYQNGATLENKGFEIELGYHGKINDLYFDINGSLSSFHDKITYLPESVISGYAGNTEKTILGHSQTSFFGYVTDGIFQNEEEVAAHATQAGKGIGRIRYKDLNNDGTIDALDQDWLGTGLPDFIYAINTDLTYKNFSLSFFLQGVQGIAVNNTDKQKTIIGRWLGENLRTDVLDAWTPENPDSPIPAASLADNNQESRFSDYYIENGSYLKLRSLQLGYTIPKELTQRIRLKNIQIYILGQNLFIIKDNKGTDRYTSHDPENADHSREVPAYPRFPSYTFGINLTL